MGAGKWDKIDPSPLTGAMVTVVADKDDAGRKHAADVVASITGLAASVVVVEAAEGKDAADHIAAGRGLHEFVPVVTPTVDGAQLLDDVAAAFDRYVVTPSAHARDGIVLWTAATHGQMAWQNATRLVVNSPEKRCGKSRLLEIVAALSHRPVLTANVSTAALFRMIGEDDPPTILLDEADAVFGTKTKADQNEDLRALLNAGYSRDLPTWRCAGAQQIPTPFTTYAMAALAGIGQMPDTITDRAVNVTMRRRAAGETIHPYRARRDRPALHVLRDRTSKWVTSNLDALKVADPVMPLEDRAADNWASLIALADLAGGDWPERARAAALALTAEHDLADAASSLNMELIHNIADIWEASGERKFISSGDLATQLRSDKDAPWAELELTPRKLSARLKWFGIKPKHNTAKTERGYHRDHFDDAIARYPSPRSNDDDNPGTAPSVSVQASEISSDLQEHDGRLSELDTSIRPAGISVRDVFADQSTIRTLGRIGTGIPGDDAPVMPGLDGSGALPESEAEFERCQLCDDRLFARPSQLSGVCGPCQAVLDDLAVAERDQDNGPLFGA